MSSGPRVSLEKSTLGLTVDLLHMESGFSRADFSLLFFQCFEDDVSR